MSIILKGIDIPEKENRMYMMELYADGHCSVAKIENGECYELTIPSETEAIQIPKGHGRLIDADLLKDMVRDSVPAYGIGVKIPTYGDMDIMDKIGFMPTILEAEEE